MHTSVPEPHRPPRTGRKVSAEAKNGEASIGCRSKLSVKPSAVSEAQGAISQLHAQQQDRYPPHKQSEAITQRKRRGEGREGKGREGKGDSTHVNTIGLSFGAFPPAAARYACPLPLPVAAEFAA